MHMLGILVQLIIAADLGVGIAGESVPIDATLPEHVRLAIAQLDDRSFQQREMAVEVLFAMGLDAVIPLREAAENLSPEVSVRAFEVLTRLYRRDDERTYEAVERAFRRLLRTNNLAAVARTERVYETIADIRQTRGIAKFRRLGGIIHCTDANSDRQANDSSLMKYILIGREWEGGDEGVRLIESFQQVRFVQTPLIIVRGAKISDATILDLRAELPYLAIQSRGPAQLGVGSSDEPGGCFIGNVEPESAAGHAGLVKGDQVIEIDGEPIDNFDTLVKVIYKKEPGDRIPIVFYREGKIHNVVAELLPWPKEPNANAPRPKP